MDILQEIVAWKRIEVEHEKALMPPARLYAQVEQIMQQQTSVRSMSQRLRQSDSGIISEFKRKSPSKGWIHQDAHPEDVVTAYERGGACAASILTDGKYFGGCMDFVRAVRPLVDLPLLRKEFIIDEYQLFQAKAIGADAVLLIAADLTKATCAQLVHTAHQLQLEVLLELHGEDELDYACCEADMLGVNNRHLGTFVTDIHHSFAMADRLPKGPVWVSESGIGEPQTVAHLREAGYRGFLMGEHFMRHPDPGAALKQFVTQVEKLVTCRPSPQ